MSRNKCAQRAAVTRYTDSVSNGSHKHYLNEKKPFLRNTFHLSKRLSWFLYFHFVRRLAASGYAEYGRRSPKQIAFEHVTYAICMDLVALAALQCRTATYGQSTVRKHLKRCQHFNEVNGMQSSFVITLNVQ